MSEVTKDAEFRVSKSPADAARTALNIIRNNVPRGTNMDSFGISEGGNAVEAKGASTAGVFHKSKIWVEARRERDATVVSVWTNDGKSSSLVNKLKRDL